MSGSKPGWGTMVEENDFTVEIEGPGLYGGQRTRLSDRPGWPRGEPRSRPYCRRFARQLVFEGIKRADVVRVSDGSIVRSYTPENAPVAKMGDDGVCPLRSTEKKESTKS